MDSNIAHELQRSHLFAGLPEPMLADLVRTVQTVRVKAGETLFIQGQPAERFYLLRSGQVKLFRLSPEGDEKIIEVMGPGQTFAEAVMFMGEHSRYPVNAAALSDASLYTFDKKVFLDVLTHSQETCFAMLAAMSRRLHMLVNQIEGLTLQNATYRLVAYLLEQIPRDHQEHVEVRLELPKNVIAARLAIQPETLSRILAKLRAGELIEVHGHQIAVRDPRALRAYAHLPPTLD